MRAHGGVRAPARTMEYLEPQIAWHDVNLTILEFLENVPAQQPSDLGEDLMADPRTKFGEIAAGWTAR